MEGEEDEEDGAEQEGLEDDWGSAGEGFGAALTEGVEATRVDLGVDEATVREARYCGRSSPCF